MSAKSKLIEFFFRVAGVSKQKTPRQYYKKLRKNAIKTKKGETIPARVSGVRAEEGVYCGMRYYTFIPKHVDSATSVLYLHGSAYMNVHKRAQERFAAEMALSVHAKIYFPIYPKLPQSTAAGCIAVLNNFYRFLLKQGSVCLVGDSSGGALALVLAEKDDSAKCVVAISPWLDARLEGVGEAEQKKDVFLSATSLRETAKLWAFDTPLSSPFLSPCKGNYNNKNILLFCGENEIFSDSIRKFYDKNRKNRSVRIEYFEGKGQPHDYPLMKTPEGAEARKILIEWLIGFLYSKSISEKLS